jgi:hypothetical protein
MTNCPVCLTKNADNANYCSDCGVHLTGAATERAWIVAMQERIKSIRTNNIAYNVVSGLGLLIAIVIPFVMRYVLLYNMDLLSWSLTGVGALLFIAGFVANIVDDRRIKKLIILLQKGQPAAEPEPVETDSLAES